MIDGKIKKLVLHVYQQDEFWEATNTLNKILQVYPPDRPFNSTTGNHCKILTSPIYPHAVNYSTEYTAVGTDLARESQATYTEFGGLVDPESALATGLRTKRATCDLLSFNSKWVTPNHAGCAAHCLLRGKKGGSCKNTICYCRN
ncbi:hypothetical protein LSTR_LSTR003747 [Laodelphax striatellus]|uniref:Invertebrate defensins family profile domain-containing protein n=1 Tax=Laodelphax striatellus TaxID=195883 RepID=A0A482WP00_LAOST|nr:hypothetical protein LSTR_LSTR003747 [Laodelphax striatellus]